MDTGVLKGGEVLVQVVTGSYHEPSEHETLASEEQQIA